MRREAHVRFLGGRSPQGEPLPDRVRPPPRTTFLFFAESLLAGAPYQLAMKYHSPARTKRSTEN